MKRYWPIFILLVAMVWWFGKNPLKYKTYRQSIPASHVAAKSNKKLPKVPPIQLSKSVDNIAKHVIRLIPRSRSINALKPHQPDPGLVAFHVGENGLAIAFGDILLGKVVGNTKIKEGVTKPRAPKLWPSGIVPYSINPGVTQPQAVKQAVNYFNTHTAVRFVPYEGEKDSVVFMPGKKICASYVGRIGGNQPIYLAPRCGVHEILHEMMHALGFIHEQSRPDRNRYLKVIWKNIKPQYYSQFYKVPRSYMRYYVGTAFAFDEHSVMLYGPKSFARAPGLVTLKARPGDVIAPVQTGLSQMDRARLFDLYGQ